MVTIDRTGLDLPTARSVAINPGQAAMREWALALTPRIGETEFGNLNYTAEVTARLAGSTFFVDDLPGGKPTVDRQEAKRWAALQDAYIADQDMILIEGFIGPDPGYRTGCRLYIERTQANIAAMQQQLYFPPDAGWHPEMTVIYTPGLPAPGMPDDRLILVDLDSYTTRVLGSDYFGESKMGGLRMWNHLVYQRGGLALHSGLKVYPDTPQGEVSVLILGLSGTGKTTTTFRQQLGSLPVQDDFNALLPGGSVRTTEAGCFAKTYGLDPDDEPTIHGGTASPHAWLENTFVGSDGRVDFFDDSHTRNGRSTFSLSQIRHRSPRDVPPASMMLLLNRSDHLIPAVSRLRRDQAAAYFMLGETKGTSAGGAAEAGKSLRVPGTNPFFFDNEAKMGNRFLELLETMPDFTVYLMNTGSIGGPPEHPDAKDMSIDTTSAVLEGIVSGTVAWEVDPDFGYEVASMAPGVGDQEVLRPRLLYQRLGREDEYRALVDRLGRERRSFLAGFPGLRDEILTAL